MTAGDILETECGPDATITFTHAPSGTVVYLGTFT